MKIIASLIIVNLVLFTMSANAMSPGARACRNAVLVKELIPSIISHKDRSEHSLSEELSALEKHTNKVFDLFKGERLTARALENHLSSKRAKANYKKSLRGLAKRVAEDGSLDQIQSFNSYIAQLSVTRVPEAVWAPVQRLLSGTPLKGFLGERAKPTEGFITASEAADLLVTQEDVSFLLSGEFYVEIAKSIGDVILSNLNHEFMNGNDIIVDSNIISQPHVAHFDTELKVKALIFAIASVTQRELNKINYLEKTRVWFLIKAARFVSNPAQYEFFRQGTERVVKVKHRVKFYNYLMIEELNELDQIFPLIKDAEDAGYFIGTRANPSSRLRNRYDNERRRTPLTRANSLGIPRFGSNR